MTKNSLNRTFAGLVWLGGSVSTIDLMSLLIRGRDLAPTPAGEVVLWGVYLVALAGAVLWRSMPDENQNGVPDRFEIDLDDEDSL